jgi:hypothetical protein
VLRARSFGMALPVVALAAVAIGCATQRAPRVDGDDMPRPPFVLEFLNASIAPAKFTGAHWDGFGSAPDALANIAALVGEPAIATASLAARLGMSATELPDPFGEIEVFRDGSTGPVARCPIRSPDDPEQNTLTPSLGCRFQLASPLSAYRFRIHLVDKDISEDDPIGIAEIGPAALHVAFDSGSVYQVNVASQTKNQILAIGISVRHLSH